ncbi:MAG TPA: peptide chain release factor N(5)-glutamine methyltransferase [Alphaproteobacteria bacterium]|nr:peptide chain release factor N(5)-glutamine methyltransferase [Alphaproteobacteria bacterium]
MTTRAQFLQEAVQRLQATEDALREARLLLAAALGLDGAEILAHGEKNLTAEEEKTADEWLSRREKGEPLSRLRGRRDFWKSSFLLNEATLDPRPETETIIEAALAHYSGAAPQRILDLGTGTGCILLSLLQEFPHASGLGTDQSARALQAAKENASRLGLQSRAQFQQTNWADGIDEKFDLIVSNPPYIPAKNIATLQPEVRLFDPPKALDGGDDGLEAYRQIAKTLPRLLKPEALAILEIGMGQDKDVEKIFAAQNFKLMEARKDLAGITRALVFHIAP